MQPFVIAHDDLLCKCTVFAVLNIVNTYAGGFVDELEGNRKRRQDQHAFVCLSDDVFSNHNLHQCLAKPGISKHPNTAFFDCLCDDVLLKIKS